VRQKPIFRRPRRIELAYESELSKLMDAWLNAPTDEDDVLSAVSAFEHAGVELNLTIRRIAAGMVTAVAKGNSNSWREAARKSTQSGRIHALLRDELNGPTGDVFWSYVSRQADLIRSIPGDLAFEAQQYIAERKVAGERADTIADALRRKFPAMKAAKVALISRTGVASTATAISRSRSERLNLNWYEWDTSEDARVRRSHRLMDLVLVNWNDPPLRRRSLASSRSSAATTPATVPTVGVMLMSWSTSSRSPGHTKSSIVASFSA
jgi:uncharacterized protein with gpF-like domain